MITLQCSVPTAADCAVSRVITLAKHVDSSSPRGEGGDCSTGSVEGMNN